MADPEVHPLDEGDAAALVDVQRTAFALGPADDALVQAWRATTDLGRALGAFDEHGRLCGVARAFPTPLTVPGGAVVATAAVTGVGVLPTHTRRGHLTRLMQAQLADVAGRGEPLAALIAAEYPIYGRFGYGPATEAVELQLDSPTARWRDQPVGTVELVEAETWVSLAEELYDRVRVEVPGHVGWDTGHWRSQAGLAPPAWDDDGDAGSARQVVWRDADGRVQGATSYTVESRWTANRPTGRLRAYPLVAATDRAEHELLRFLTTVDWARTVAVPLRPVDDAAPLAMVDGRAATLADRGDHLWLRMLDVPAALAARRYARPGTLVLEVADPAGHATGRFRLDAEPGGATCARTGEDADLTVPVGALGAAYLGGTGWGRLAAAGWVDEHRAGAVARATALFTPPRAPWCPRTF
ncbi:MAG TPA: GNAT family N-acetyltransferase [Acidimicrobiales bacterium]|nr:GNAT family N-acetyltransferase [Acidimicrobiales bacterium]